MRHRWEDERNSLQREYAVLVSQVTTGHEDCAYVQKFGYLSNQVGITSVWDVLADANGSLGLFGIAGEDAVV